MEEKNLFILHSQDHGCWWPGNMGSQGIGSKGFDQFILENSGFSPRKVKNNWTYEHQSVSIVWEYFDGFV